ncbi:helix-turn-helix domain-containing transcriptional regulator [Dryocola clanedunensis]
MTFSDHDQFVIEMLRDDHSFAVEYLKEALAELDKEDGEALFLLALRRLVEARGGISKIARAANLNRETLYRTLSERGNPTISTTKKIFHAAGIHFSELTGHV